MSQFVNSYRFASGWTPAALSPHVWLAADALPLADNDAISTYTDQSGNGRSPTASGTNRPTFKTAILNGLSVARFDGSSDHMSVAFTTLAQPLTVVSVVNFAGVSAVQPLTDSLNTASCWVYHQSASIRMAAGGTPIVGPSVSAATTYAVAAIFNFGSSKLWVNGGAATTGSPGTNGITNGLRVGMDRGGSFRLGGDHAETILLSGAISLADLNTLGTYLQRWGLTWTTAT